MACLTKLNTLFFVLMQIILKWSYMSRPLTRDTFALRPEMYIEEMWSSCCLAVCHILSVFSFLLVQFFPFPKPPFVPVSIFYAKHLMFMDFSMIHTLHWHQRNFIQLKSGLYIFVCFHIVTGFVFKCFHVRVCVERKMWKREKIVSKLLIKSLF